MSTAEHDPTSVPTDLAGWDWLAELRRQDRSIPWLARRTDRSQQMVYHYAHGKRPVPAKWLEMAAIVLGKDV
jgi:hypothetical protein